MKIKSLSFLLYFLFPLSIFAQQSKFYVGLGGGIDVYDYEFFDNPIDNIKHQFSKTDGYSIGMRLNFGPVSKVRFSAGAYFSQKGYKLIYNWTSSIDGDAEMPKESILLADFVDIPLSFNYRLIGKNSFHISPSIGVMTSVNLENNEFSIMGDGSEIASNNISELTNSVIANLLFAGKFSLIIGIDLSKAMFISLEPLLGMVSNVGVMEHSFDIG